MANIQLSYNLKRYREAYRYTQQKLADKINISRQAWVQIKIVGKYVYKSPYK
nr:helix-turn-helix transcriptional regulator [uncultured Schaedlerella sp.]